MQGRTGGSSGRVARWCVWIALAASCSDPLGFDPTPVYPDVEEVCAASAEWLPITSEVSPSGMFMPLPHPAGECPFYRASWQSFLIATQPASSGEPALVSYSTIDDTFQPATPRPARGPQRAWLGFIKQPGGQRILLDPKGQLIYYGIHVNRAYVDFIHAHHLETAKAIQNADSNLFFPAGIVEIKSAWQRVDPREPTLGNFISTNAWVARVHQVNGELVEDRASPMQVTVRLLALHVAFTLPGHPELVWATFEHSGGTPDLTTLDGQRDVAPIDPRVVNPIDGDPHPETVVSNVDYALYRSGTTIAETNHPHPETELILDDASQTFPGQTSSIYRMFPASKSNTTHPEDAITSLNFNVEALFRRAAARGALAATDKRGHYRLVGALWMDKPAYFQKDQSFQNDDTSPLAASAGFSQEIKEKGSDSALSIVAGEDRLSSTAMETFTQAPDSFHNCLACHNTQATTARGVPVNRDRLGVKLLEPKLINVSRVLSQFVLEECGANVVIAPDGTRRAVCP